MLLFNLTCKFVWDNLFRLFLLDLAVFFLLPSELVSHLPCFKISYNEYILEPPATDNSWSIWTVQSDNGLTFLSVRNDSFFAGHSSVWDQEFLEGEIMLRRSKSFDDLMERCSGNGPESTGQHILKVPHVSRGGARDSTQVACGCKISHKIVGRRGLKWEVPHVRALSGKPDIWWTWIKDACTQVRWVPLHSPCTETMGFPLKDCWTAEILWIPQNSPCADLVQRSRGFFWKIF
jgi:hypothetical protein